MEYIYLLIGMILQITLGVNGLVNIPAPWILWVYWNMNNIWNIKYSVFGTYGI